MLNSKAFTSGLTNRACTLTASYARINYNQMERAYRKGASYSREEWIAACEKWKESNNEIEQKMGEVILRWMAEDDKFGKRQYR